MYLDYNLANAVPGQE